MLKTIFEFLTEPLGLPIECYWEYLILAIIGFAAYIFAYKKVGQLYRSDMISGKTAGSIIHWVIRLIFFVVIWAITYFAVVAFRWIQDNYIVVITIALIIILTIIISCLVIKTIRNKKKDKTNEDIYKTTY